MKRLIVALFVVLSLFAGEMDTGSKTVTTAGTAVQLVAVSTPAVWVIVQAKPGNSGAIFVGVSDVADGNGVELAAGDSVKYSYNPGFEDYDLAEIWIDTDNNGDGVTFVYFKR